MRLAGLLARGGYLKVVFATLASMMTMAVVRRNIVRLLYGGDTLMAIVRGGKMGSQLDFITILKMALEKEVKQHIEEQIVKPIIESLEEQIRGIVRDKLKEVSFERIETMRDAMRLRDELAISIKINGED